jgi:hypothetical protein
LADQSAQLKGLAKARAELTSVYHQQVKVPQSVRLSVELFL